MASTWTASIFLASVLCLVSLCASVAPEPHFYIEGKVYCDTCRIQFVTRISQYMKDATVRLECREREDGQLKYTTEAMTNGTGSYTIKVSHDHEDEVCEMMLVKSSDPECAEINHDDFRRRSARISLTTQGGMTSKTRVANPIGFMRKDPLPECAAVLRELGITPDGKVVEE